MPMLGNQRHELFAQELAKGKTASEAYILAGYRPSRKNASRLRANEGVTARLAELQAVTAQSARITIKSICRELDEANTVAKERGQASAMVSASALRAKLAGLMVEKVELGGPGDFEQAETVEDVADIMIQELVTAFRPVSDADRRGLVELLERQADETGEFLAAIRARPVNGIRFENPANVEARAARRRLTLSRSQ